VDLVGKPVKIINKITRDIRGHTATMEHHRYFRLIRNINQAIDSNGHILLQLTTNAPWAPNVSVLSRKYTHLSTHFQHYFLVNRIWERSLT
jgi:hypothetical protein